MKFIEVVNQPYSPDTDFPFWVPKDMFFEHFDLADYDGMANGTTADQVQDVYADSWFRDTGNSSVVRFEFGTVHVKESDRRFKTEFNNGRHRTHVLWEHLDRMPLNFIDAHIDGSGAYRFVRKLNLQSVAEGETVLIPDLERRPYRDDNWPDQDGPGPADQSELPIICVKPLFIGRRKPPNRQS